MLDEVGASHTLLDLTSVYANRSKIPTNLILQDGSEKHPLGDIFQTVMNSFNGLPLGGAYIAVLAMAMNEMVRKYRPLKFMRIGGKDTAFDEVADKMLKSFHDGSLVYHVNDNAMSSGGDTVHGYLLVGIIQRHYLAAKIFRFYFY